jgi:hypothetical protein
LALAADNARLYEAALLANQAKRHLVHLIEGILRKHHPRRLLQGGVRDTPRSGGDGRRAEGQRDRDLEHGYQGLCHDSVITGLMGGTPAEVPEHYTQASAIELLPLRCGRI